MSGRIDPALVPGSVVAACEENLANRRSERSEDLAKLRLEIEACSDEATLRGHFLENADLIDEINDRLRAHREGMGIDLIDEGMMRRSCDKVAVCAKIKRWAEHRMLELGFKVPYPPSDPRARELRHLNDRMDKLRHALRRNGLDDRGEKLAA